jgi:pimeloyl-ACP methyl ester carboxylesterase
VDNVYVQNDNNIRTMATTRESRSLEFPYDWRHSNRTSAAEFTQFLCDNASVIKGRPLIFYAHSMGGLVLKNWLLHEYRSAPCPNSGPPVQSLFSRIDRIIYVGTPHLGAPMAIEALAHEYNVSGKGDGGLLNYFKGGAGRHFSRALNIFGGTFPSLYELLPASQVCFAAIPVTAEVSAQDGKFYPISNIFHYDIWKNYRWPKNLYGDDTASKDQFIAKDLQARLKAAQDVSCDLVAHDWSKENFPTVRIYSDSVRSTTCRVIVREPDVTGRSPDMAIPQLCPGDGTVPAYAASENTYLPDAIKDNDPRSIRLPGGHQELATVGLSELNNVFIEALNKRTARIAELLKAPAPALDRPIVPLSPGAISASPPSRQSSLTDIRNATLQSNEAIIALQNAAQPGVSRERQLVREALSQSKQTDLGSRLKRIDAYLIASDLQGLDARNRAWALNNAADASLAVKDYRKARSLAADALEAAEQVTDRYVGREMRNLRGKAALIGAHASHKLGDKAEATRLRGIAINNGNPLARSMKL